MGKYKVIGSGKRTLYRIYCDNVKGASYETFIWSDHAPTDDEVAKVAREDFSPHEEWFLDEVENIVRENNELFEVYARGL